ncbi:MAG: ATP-binding protein [Lachnospiraceae bacterium]|nr:ATP-binding protein [Lachnospiraceae bacterium]
MEAKRKAYINDLVIRRHNGMIKVVTGVRRSGKSYLLFKLFKKHLKQEGVPDSHIIEIQLDNRKYRELQNPDNCYRYVEEQIKDRKMHYLLLDEVQLMEDFESVLNGFLHIDNLDVYVTGSNSRFLSSDVITEFRGRGDEVRIYPLSFKELYETKGLDFDDAWIEYQTFGGLPALLPMETEKQKIEYLESLFRNVYLNDVLERNTIRNSDMLDDLVNVLASSIGAPTNPTNIANTYSSIKKSSCSPKTISAYIKYLEDAFLISGAERYDIKGRKYIGSNKKYYFVDVGLRNAKLGFKQQEPTHIMENIIYNELLVRGFKVDVGNVEINERNKQGISTRKQLEVDFVANRGNERIYIQSAYQLPTEDKWKQERKSLQQIRDSFKKVIIMRDNTKPWRDENGFVIMGLKDFLLSENSLDF